MSYATHEDLVARYGAREIECLLDQDGDGRADAGRADAALADASAEIDAVLARCWILPLEFEGPWPALTAIACALARQALHDDRQVDSVDAAARRARRLLDDIAAGRANLVTADGMTLGRTAPAGLSASQTDDVRLTDGVLGILL